MEKLNDFELDAVAGGRAFVDPDNPRVKFSTIDHVIPLKCSPYLAMEAMNALVGQFDTEEEFDNACYQMLVNNGWV